jgi:hypothetical protein
VVRVRMTIDYSQYLICVDDVQEDDSNADEFAPGLAQWQPGEVIVTAADQNRSLDIQVEILDVPPSDSIDGHWQDAAEFSLETTDGEIRLVQLMEGAKGPNLASRGPGAYRLRLCATDRDAIAGKKPREQHRLEVWPAPVAETKSLRLTSQFAVDWATPPPPPREIDWTDLASTPGARLIVGWKSLVAPAGRREDLELCRVQVSGVVEGSPAHVFHRFGTPAIGGMASGSQSGGGTQDGRTMHADITYPEDRYDLREEPPSERARWIGDLGLVTQWHEVKRFSRLRVTMGFEEHFFGREYDESGVRFIPGPRIEGRAHPLPVGSTTIQFDFSKHADGRLVTIAHDGVPRWLHDDVQALWRIVLDANRRHSKWKAAMPWDDYEPTFD